MTKPAKSPPKTVAEKRQARSKITAEIFTPPWLVNEMLDKLPETNWEPTKTFLDPAAGNGNMLLEVLRRKLDKGHDPLQALKTIYGVDIIVGNIQEARLRLLKLIQERGFAITKEMLVELFSNIVVTRISPRYPQGALDYDFEFYRRQDANDSPRLDLWMNAITKKNLLNRFESEPFNEIIGDKEEDEPDALKEDPRHNIFGVYDELGG